MILKLLITKVVLLGFVVACNAVLQNIHITYCKRNLILHYLMKEASLCKTLHIMKTLTEDIGLGVLDGLFSIPLPIPKLNMI